MEVGLLINFGSKSLEFKRVMNKKNLELWLIDLLIEWFWRKIKVHH
jgi:hypothetical protein